MRRLILTLALTAVDWFPSEPPPPALFPVVAPDEEQEKRRTIYVQSVERAKKNGACTYQSDGRPGSYLPKGRYRLFWAKGRDGVWDVFYEEDDKIIPRPDPAAIKESLECLS